VLWTEDDGAEAERETRIARKRLRSTTAHDGGSLRMGTI
jgi:hypothetical protein